jgi:hypothetical protein
VAFQSHSEEFLLKRENSQTPVAHAYNPSCSGGRDQEDLGSKPAWANSSRDPQHEKELMEWLK